MHLQHHFSSVANFHDAIKTAKEVATTFWERGESFHAVVLEDKKRGNYDIHVRPFYSPDYSKDARHHCMQWVTCGLQLSSEACANANNFELVLPAWHVDYNKHGTVSNMLRFAEEYTQKLQQLRDAYDLIQQANRSTHLSDDQLKDVRTAAELWRKNEFTFAYNSRGMVLLENPIQDVRTIQMRSPDRLVDDLTVYPLFAIQTGQIKWFQGNPSNINKDLKKALATVAKAIPRYVGDEYIISDAQGYQKSLNKKTANNWITLTQELVCDKSLLRSPKKNDYAFS